MLSERRRTLLVLHGIGLLISSALSGWLYFFQLLGEIDLWPIIRHVDVQVPGEARGWNMAHLEGITKGLVLMALAAVAPFIRLSAKQSTWLFYSSLTFAWLFTLPAIANAFFGTRGLAFGGGPFGDSLANNVIYLMGWPPIIAVHIAFGLMFWGAWSHLKKTSPTSARSGEI